MADNFAPRETLKFVGKNPENRFQERPPRSDRAPEHACADLLCASESDSAP